MIEELRETDIPNVFSLHNEIYHESRSAENWIWEYKGYLPTRFVFTVVKDSGKIVGTQGMIPLYLNIGGHRYLSGKSENTLIDKKYRGTGLSSALYDFALSVCNRRGMYCVWGFTPIPRAIGLLRKMGFTVFHGVMRRSVLILNRPNRQFVSSILHSRENLTRKIGRCLLIVLLFAYSRAFVLGHVMGRNLSVKREPVSGADTLKMYNRLRGENNGLIHLVQDEEYMTWRISRNPSLQYEKYFAYEGNLLRAYCYVALGGGSRASVSDLTFQDWNAGEFLLMTVLNRLRKRGTTSVSFVGNVENPLVSRIFDLLKKHGFVMLGSESFVLKDLCHPNGPHIRNIADWYMNGLWTEGYEW